MLIIALLIMSTTGDGVDMRGSVYISGVDVHVIAVIIAGEAPYSLMGHDAAAAVAWTIRNRMKTSPLEDVLRYYHARGEAMAIEEQIVREVFSLDESQDPTHGALYALSEDDRQNYRLRAGDTVIVGDCGLALHFYVDNPF